MDNKMTTMEQEGKEEAVQGIAEAMDGAAPTEEGSVPPEETDAPVRNRYADLMNGPKRRVPERAPAHQNTGV